MPTRDQSSFEEAVVDLERAPTAVTLHAFPPHPSSGESSNGPVKQVTAQDWTDNDDENPFNWPQAKKVYHACIPALFSFVVTFASSVYAPGYPGVMQQFHASSTVALLPLSLYILGQAFGPIIAAPASETYGRRIVLLVTLPLFALFILGAGFSQTFAALAACRLFAADLYAPRSRVYASTLQVLSGLLGPALGPVVGAFAAQDKGWRWTQWCILFLTVAAYIFALPMSETYKIILKCRAVRLCIDPPPERTPPGLAGLKIFLRVTLTRPLHMLVTEPIVGFFSLYVAFNFAVMYTFYAGLPYVFASVYHFNSLGHENLPFLALGLGCVLAFPSAILVNKIFYEKQYLKSTQGNGGKPGTVTPEHRLYIAMTGSLGLPVGLFWFAWSAKSNVNWIVPIIAIVPFGWGNMCVFMASNLYLQDTYGALYGASATAANNLARYTLGAVFPLFSLQMMHNLGIGWAISLLGFISLALLPLPWVLFKWGPTIRKRSLYAPSGKTGKT